MIPCFFIGVHGVMMAMGVFVGMYFADRMAKQLGLDHQAMSSVLTWAVVGGFVFAHIFAVLAYRTADFLKTPWILFTPGRGWSMSSFGVFFGAALGVFACPGRKNVPVGAYGEALAFGAAPASACGRLGCFLVHDQLGRRTDFFLAVRFPGGARHDLGLDEALFWIFLTAFFLVFSRKRRPPGTYLMLVCLSYGPVRFLLDFLRATDIRYADPRYFGLTLGQYGSLVVTIVGFALAGNAWRRRFAIQPQHGGPSPTCA